MQLKPFNQSKGGSKPGYCLQNVRLGYGIPALYNDAWTAWQNTEQHKNKTFPKLDIPLYYDYTDKAGNRYGHINVRLKDGRIWNDGEIYISLTSFLSYHSNVKYVGWGESVNNVKVIGEEMLTKDVAGVIVRAYSGRTITAEELKAYVGKETADDFIKRVKGWGSAKNAVTRSKNGTLVAKNHLMYTLRSVYVDPSKAKIAELTKVNAIQQKEIERLKATQGDSTKWETLKVLLRELIGR